MHIEARLFEFIAAFFVLVTVLYGVLTALFATGGVEWAGTTALALTSGLALITATFFRFVARRLDTRPEDYEGADLLAPTRLYLDVARRLRGRAKGFAHITGGGVLGNLSRVLPQGTAAELDWGSWERPPVFGWLARHIDEDELRRLAVRELEELGYLVLAAANGVEALQVARSLERPVDLLVTDVVMPEMNGVELAESLVDLWPELAVLFMSGHLDEGAMERHPLDPDADLLPKPFTPDQLGRRARHALDRAESNRRIRLPKHLRAEASGT